MLGRPGDELLGLVQDFIQKLRNRTISRMEAAKFLRREDPWNIVAEDFPVWKTLKLGTPQDYLTRPLTDMLAHSGCDIGAHANHIISQIGVLVTEMEVDLVALSVSDLGFNRAATYGEILNRAHGFGLTTCYGETAPQLVLQKGGDLQGMDQFTVMMEPIRIQGTNSRFVLSVGRGSGLWIAKVDVERIIFFPAERFIFMRPRP